MAEEKKPKIDLKARLGKKTVSAPTGGAVPPPVGLPKQVPAPPFATANRPKVDASNPYASISADQAPKRAEPAAIKVEMSQEVVEAQRKGRSKIIVLAGITALLGGFIGFAVGSGVERGKAATSAVTGAEDLVKDVDAATAKAEELADILKAAQAKLKDNKYPVEEVGKLGAIDIPFSGANLTGKGIGRFKPEVVTLLISFASSSKEANDGKDKVQSILSGAKQPIEDFLAQQTNPKVRWSVYVESGPGGPWVSMQSLPEPFKVKEEDKEKAKNYKWPETFKLKQGDKTFELPRYSSGDPTKPKKQGEPYIIPVNPDTQGAVCPTDVVVRLTRELRDLEEVLRGDKTPGEEKDGLMDTGKMLVDKLKGIGKP